MSDHDAPDRSRGGSSMTPPPLTDALRAEARAHPGGWVYAVDAGFDGAADVPPQGIVGAWRSDENGEVREEFVPNPRYVATPRARGWAEPATPLEDVLQLVRAGYGSTQQLLGAFASADVVVFSRPEGGLFLAPAQDGGRLVYAYTDAAKATAAGYAEHATLRGSELAAAVPAGVRIVLNPGSEPAAVIDPTEVTAP